ncbi:MAG: histone deacetylase [Deltaproteobacteria bacterium]|nr:histone deacetylase [Deltaproteobacteria bacterium]
MKKTGLLYDERYMLHKTGPDHPECPERLAAIYQGLQQGGLLNKLVRIPAHEADRQWIETVHSKNYIKRLQEACQKGLTEFDLPDNQMSRETFEIALLAVGGILTAVDMVMTGELDNAFCAIRPPGHHAEADKALGFCYFNNVAIAARYIQAKYKIQRIGIVDFDVHHGNGTQHHFEDDPFVYFYSIHEHPSFAYPGTGREFERGRDMGWGYTLNSPMLPGAGDKEYQETLVDALLPAFDVFQPEVILVSTGFDAHIEDDMSDINLTTEGFSWIIKKIVEMADNYARGRLISILEGGYCLARLPELARDHVAVMLDI